MTPTCHVTALRCWTCFVWMQSREKVISIWSWKYTKNRE